LTAPATQTELRQHCPASLILVNSHASVVDLLDRVRPVLYGPPVRIEEREVERRVTVGLPGHVEERRSRDVDDPDPEQIQVVERSVRHETLDVSSMTKLSAV
jgi:hypothetical protein